MIIKVGENNFEIDEVYQDIYGTEIIPKRSSWERLRTILTADRSFNAGVLEYSSICDIGSCFGYFLLKMAETNKNKMLGVERNKTCFKISEQINKTSNVKFTNKIYQDVIDLDYQAYLALSVFHHSMNDGLKFLNNISSHAQTIYVEQATHNEWAYFGTSLLCEGNPYFYWLKKFEEATERLFTIRLVGVHRTHLNTLRPLYQLKRKLSLGMRIKDKFYIVSDIWSVPYMEFGLPRIGPQNYNEPLCINRPKNYMYATDTDGQEYFIKKIEDEYKIMPKYNGFLLSDILRWGLLPWFDKIKIRSQIYDMIKTEHLDFTPWNLIIDSESNVFAIDGDDNPGYIKKELLWDLILNIV